MRFGLRAFAPVGDGSGYQNLALAKGADLGRGTIAHHLALSLATSVLCCPVPAHALGIPLAELLVANAAAPRHVTYPERNRALGDAEFRSDLVIGSAAGTHLTCSCVQFVLGSRP